MSYICKYARAAGATVPKNLGGLQPRKPKRVPGTPRCSPERLQQIADSLRAHGPSRTARDLHVGWSTIQFVQGEMDLGRLGGR